MRSLRTLLQVPQRYCESLLVAQVVLLHARVPLEEVLIFAYELISSSEGQPISLRSELLM